MKRAPTRSATLLSSAGAVARRRLEVHRGRAWPAEKWQSDPVGFSTTILGVQLWSAQVEILEAIRDNTRVAVSGGRKIGKDFVLAVAALWWYASFADARVFSTATTGKQVDGILYRQIRSLYAGSGKCLDCKRADAEKRARGERIEPPPCKHSAMLTGDVGKLARTGIVAPDMREILGYTADDEEGLAGMSGARLLVIEDEASGIADPLHVALRGNLAAAGCRHVMISNPTKTYGHFHAAFHGNAHLWRTIRVSSRTTPNVREDREVFPGLADAAWIKDQESEWGGPSSPLVRVHIDGEFVREDIDTVPFPVDKIAEASQRWESTPAEGALAIGVDPAGEGLHGDESVFAPRRGKKILELYPRRGISPEAHVVEVLGLITKYGTGGEPVRVVIDVGGMVGSKVWGAFHAYVQAHEDSPLELVKVDASDRAQRKPEHYDRVRDELVGSLADWMRDGGAIPPDAKLAGELNAFRWGPSLGRAKLVAKDKMREQLGRSPDRADAASLSTWGPRFIGAGLDEGVHAAPTRGGLLDLEDELVDGRIDPYGDRIDPYG